jgi:hypothetical protein
MIFISVNSGRAKGKVSWKIISKRKEKMLTLMCMLVGVKGNLFSVEIDENKLVVT